MHQKLRHEHSSPMNRATDIYVITMLLIFPLFPGFSGYAAITFSKFLFFMIATGLWLTALVIITLRQRPAVSKLSLPQTAALVYLLVCTLSLIVSPQRASAFLGAGRYDGFLTTAACVFIFLGCSAYSRPKLLYAHCFALSVSLCAIIALGQLADLNPLRLFPDGLSFYDAGLMYSGTFLGTIGNTNILDSVLCLALPLFFGLYVCGGGGCFLVPLLAAVPILLKAGGDGGRLSLILTALVALPLLLTEISRIRSALRCAAYILIVSALSMLWQPGRENGFAFAFSRAACWLFAASPVLFALSFCPLPKGFSPIVKTLRRFFSALSALFFIVGLVFVFSAESGTLYELGQLLHGNAEDSFGSSRIGIWRACLALVPERPLLGGGPGTLALRLNIEFSRFVPETGQTLKSFVDNAHNVYLGALVNTGFLGLAALLLLLISSAAAAWKRVVSPLHLSFALSALACAIQEFFGLGLCLSAPIFWLFLGLICCSQTIPPEDIA